MGGLEGGWGVDVAGIDMELVALGVGMAPALLAGGSGETARAQAEGAHRMIGNMLRTSPPPL